MPWRNWEWTGEMICCGGNQANNLTCDSVQIAIKTTAVRFMAQFIKQDLQIVLHL